MMPSAKYEKFTEKQYKRLKRKNKFRKINGSD